MGFLDDVESIVINNKEVQSIIDSNGGIIYEKSSGGYELVLTGNKSIIQTGESVTLSATLTNNNVPVSGEIVIFDGLYGEQVITTVEDTSIIMNGDYKIILPNSQSNHQDWISIQGTDKNIIFGYYPANTSYYMEVDGFPIWITGNSVQVIGSSIYYVDENGEDAVLDVSDCNYNTVLTPFQVGGVILETIFSSITDNNGIATVSYTGKGTGDLNIQAYDPERIISSEIYLIEDCILFQSNPSPCTNCNIALPNSAEISFKMSKPRITGSYGGVHLEFVDNTSHAYFVGNWASGGENGLLIRNVGSSSNLVALLGTHIAANTEYLLGVTYKDNAWTYFKDNEISSGTANYTPTKISVIHIQQGTMKDLKIKPL